MKFGGDEKGFTVYIRSSELFFFVFLLYDWDLTFVFGIFIMGVLSFFS